MHARVHTYSYQFCSGIQWENSGRESRMPDTHTHTHTHTCTHTPTHLHTSAYPNTHAHACTHIHLLWHTAERQLQINQKAANTHTHTHMLTHTRTYTHTHTHMHTHTPLQHTLQHTLQRTATQYNTLHYTALHCIALQYTATHCNTHPATHCSDWCNVSSCVRLLSILDVACVYICCMCIHIWVRQPSKYKSPGSWKMLRVRLWS